MMMFLHTAPGRDPFLIFTANEEKNLVIRKRQFENVPQDKPTVHDRTGKYRTANIVLCNF
jgi:hypothetical protein